MNFKYFFEYTMRLLCTLVYLFIISNTVCYFTHNKVEFIWIHCTLCVINFQKFYLYLDRHR